MFEKLQNIQIEATEKINQSASLNELNELRVLYLGKKGPIQEAMKTMKTLEPDARAEMGKISNQVKTTITNSIEVKKIELEAQEILKKIEEERIDISLPSYSLNQGTKHPLTLIVDEIVDVFISMGYSVAEGPEVETDRNNFELLNIPKDHPARDMQDTFYIDETLLLRSQTSPVQARVMLESKGEKPIKIICPGKTYRRDDDDATHSHQFMQIEGLVIDKNITMSDLKGTLELLIKRVFGENRDVRLRPSYFPFTEPSAEVDISCHKCGGKGCNLCSGTGWIEILGSGMVNPKVLELCGYDPTVYQGFAFGVGVERAAMLKYGIDNIRNFYTNDLRFLNQFNRKD
jgi:phenylalanyl-tRNA synthetase, alpha subunit